MPVRLIGDRAAIFENDPNTKKEFYWLASQGIPIRLRFNPIYFPEIDHWKAAIFVGQGVTAAANTPYTLWIRVEALDNSKWSDSVWVQFSNAQVNGSPAYGIGTSSGLVVNLSTDSGGASDQQWGWVNGAYWLVQAATDTFPTSGTQTLRIQPREYGVMFDQIVLSPTTYLNSSASCPNACGGAPGPVSGDTTIVPKP